jgi:hypothetical protein
LELIDDEVGKALLQFSANTVVVSNEVARLDQEIEEIEAAQHEPSILHKHQLAIAAPREEAVQGPHHWRR